MEIAARDTLVKGYIKLKLNTTDGVPLDDQEDPDAAAGEMTLDKVREWTPEAGSRRVPEKCGIYSFIYLRTFLLFLLVISSAVDRASLHGEGATMVDEGLLLATVESEIACRLKFFLLFGLQRQTF